MRYSSNNKLKLTSMLSKFRYKKKSRTKEAENRQKLKTASLNSKFTGCKKEECTSTCSVLENVTI